MSDKTAKGLRGGMSMLCILILACGDGETPSAPTTQQLQASRSVASIAGLAGRIVYTNKGLRVYNLATSADVSLGTSGVNPEFSPDGTLITYQNNGIKVMNSDGTNVRVLSASGGSPSFDPTGTMIAFKNNGIWKINVDGTGLTQLMADDAHSPAWSPDGTQIAYGSIVGSLVQLFIMNADGTNRQQVLTSGSVIDVTWKPSSKLLFGVLSGNYELHSFDPVNPSSLTRLTTSKASDFEPSWSPDGTQISWVAGTSGPTSGIWMMNTDGSGKLGPVIPKGRQGSWGR